MEDQQIIEMYLERNEDAISQTERKYTKYCHSIAIHILHIPEDADEALNDTWLAAWNSIPHIFPNACKHFLAD